MPVLFHASSSTLESNIISGLSGQSFTLISNAIFYYTVILSISLQQLTFKRYFSLISVLA